MKSGRDRCLVIVKPSYSVKQIDISMREVEKQRDREER